MKLGRLLDTLPERLALARTESLPHADFLDRCSCPTRSTAATATSADAAGPGRQARPGHAARHLQHRQCRRAMTAALGELCSLRFLDDARGALILGPVGVGKTHLATALGHIAIRRRHSVHFARADQLFRRLKAARLDNTVEAEMRRLARVDLLIIDDFALQAMDAHRDRRLLRNSSSNATSKTATVLTSQPRPLRVDCLMSDPLLAQSAIDRLVSTSYELVVEGQSYRRRQRPRHDPTDVARIDQQGADMTIIKRPGGP